MQLLTLLGLKDLRDPNMICTLQININSKAHVTLYWLKLTSNCISPLEILHLKLNAIGTQSQNLNATRSL